MGERNQKLLKMSTFQLHITNSVLTKRIYISYVALFCVIQQKYANAISFELPDYSNYFYHNYYNYCRSYTLSYARISRHLVRYDHHATWHIEPYALGSSYSESDFRGNAVLKTKRNKKKYRFAITHSTCIHLYLFHLFSKMSVVRFSIPPPTAYDLGTALVYVRRISKFPRPACVQTRVRRPGNTPVRPFRTRNAFECNLDDWLKLSKSQIIVSSFTRERHTMNPLKTI